MRLFQLIPFLLLSLTSLSNLGLQEDSILNRINKEKDKEKQVEILIEYAQDLKKTSPYLSIEKALKAIEISKKIKSNKWLTLSYRVLAQNFELLSDHSKALENFNNSLEHAQKIDLDSLIYLNRIDIGEIYSNLGNHEIALKIYSDVLSNSVNEENDLNIALALEKRANIKIEIGDIQNAIKDLNNALNIYSLYKKDNLHSDILITISKLESNLGNYRNSIELLNRLELELINTGENIKRASVLNQKAELLLNQYNYDSSLNDISLRKNILHNALRYTDLSLELLQKTDELSIKASNYKVLAFIYEKLNQYKSAFENENKYRELADSIYNIQKSKEILAFQNEEELILENDIEAEQEFMKLKKEDRKIGSYLLIGFLFFQIIILFLIILKKDPRYAWLIRGLTFLSFITIYEFILLRFENTLNDFSDGLPFLNFFILLCLALAIFPLFQYIEAFIMGEKVES